MAFNIPETGQQRVVIIGAGFGGLEAARRLRKSDLQIVLVDKNNYHQFQPLFYQVAMAGLEPSSISFPLRKIFQSDKNVFIRYSEIERIDAKEKRIYAALGYLNYDVLILATGATTNFYGNSDLERNTLPMKSISEALYIRNALLSDFEEAVSTRDYERRQELIDIVVVGGGATGVEVAGSLAEMKKYILPKDYRELEYGEVDIYLIHAGDRLLPAMSKKASRNAEKYLKQLGVIVIKNKRVKSADGSCVRTTDGDRITCAKVIWAAGITCPRIEGLPDEIFARNNRIKVDPFCRVIGLDSIFVVGDGALMETEDYPHGHPQVAQGAIQMGRNVAQNLRRRDPQKWKPFVYRDKGSMATIGRNKAVVDLKKWKFGGFFAWLVWLTVHLYALLGVRNRLVVFLNWVWNYFSYDQSLRLIIRPDQREQSNKET